MSTGEKHTLDWLLFSVVMRNDVFYYFLHSDCYFLAKMLLKKFTILVHFQKLPPTLIYLYLVRAIFMFIGVGCQFRH